MIIRPLFNKLALLLFIASAAASCSTKSSDSTESPASEQSPTWFSQGEWKQGWQIMPSKTLDSIEFSLQYHKNPERWSKAFKFLSETNLAELEAGTYALDSPRVFAIVSEYVSKEETETRFEGHEKYADIQYVIYGVEKIGVFPKKDGEIVTPYDPAKDICFLTTAENNYQFADQDVFFIFFPHNAHRPGIRVDEGVDVKKMVVKVRVE